MKPISLTAIALGTLVLCGASLPSSAQTESQAQGQMPAPSTDVQQPTPAPIVIETKVDLKSGGPQTPESSYDAHKEAAAALAEAKTACRRESGKQAQSECLRQARDDYNATLARAMR